MLNDILIFLLILCLIAMLVCFFFIFRNNYTYNCSSIASKCVSGYTKELLEKGEYDLYTNYYNKFEYDYNKHLYNLKLWGRYSCIKPEYREMLKKYDRR